MESKSAAAKGDHVAYMKQLLMDGRGVRAAATEYLKFLFPAATLEGCALQAGILAGLLSKAIRAASIEADPIKRDVGVLCAVLPIFADVGMLSLAANIPTAEPVSSQAEEKPTGASAGLGMFFREDWTADLIVSETRNGKDVIALSLPLDPSRREQCMGDLREAERSIDPRAGHWTRRVVKVRRDGAEFIGKAA